MNHLTIAAHAASLFLLVALSVADAEHINPYPRALIQVETLQQWTFDGGAEGWAPTHHCAVSAAKGLLRIESTGGDPYLSSPQVKLAAPVAVRLRMRSKAGGGGQIFWTTTRSRGTDERKSARFRLEHDGRWHVYSVPLDATGTVTMLRLDPGSAPGLVEVDSIEIVRAMHHPLEIQRIEASGREVVVHLRNHSPKPLAFSVQGQSATIPGGALRHVALKPKGTAPFEAMSITVESKGLPSIQRTVFLHHPQAETQWLTLRSKTLTLRAAPDGSGARIERGGKVVAVIAPLVHWGTTPFKETGAIRKDAIVFARAEMGVRLSVRGDEVSVVISNTVECEGPMVRALGALEQGLFAGIEHLGKGERSSSRLDIETPEHIRFAPDRLKVTMPLMAAVTDKATVAMAWDDMSLQPVYAVPNFFDGTPDHRMALRGKRIKATILVRQSQPLEEAILWAVEKRGGLPDLPKPPRTRDQQWALCLKCLNGPVKGEGGWGHCAEARWPRHPYAPFASEARWPRHPYAPFASTIWRLTGDAPRLEKLVGGGSHVRNDAIYFIQSRVAEWLEMRRRRARGTAKGQQPDGSWRYKGKYGRTHFEDTASGICARPAATLLEFAWTTGDKPALDAGLKALEYMKRFRTPRGAQTWECPLHIPDVLASAYLVWAYTRGYELTGREDFLAEARRWALSGVPFAYQWTCKPMMLYATPPVLGATNWRAPNWIGRPVQWCGGVYAYALALLAPYEKTLDWAKLARGILISAEQQQYPDGKFVGCLPDSIDIAAQTRHPWNINPCALVSLRLILDGRIDSLAVAADDRHRVAAPFPVTLKDGKAHIQAKPGLAYQVLVDGTRIVDVESKGTDVVPLD